MVGKTAEKDNDSDSVIYMSDDSSIASITEISITRHASIESIVIDNISCGEEEEDTDDDTNGDVILQEEKFTVKETVEEVQEEIVKKYEDKATQTFDNEFPTKPPSQTSMTDNTSGVNTTNTPGFSGVVTFRSSQPTPTVSGSVSASNITSATISTSIRATNESYRNTKNSNSKTTIREKSPVNFVQTRRTYSHAKSYRNYRVQPYKRYNNNKNNNYNRSNFTNHNTNYNNNYNRNYNYGNNRYNTARYHNNYRYNHNNVQSYRNQFFTNQFKERLFRGFINLMDYVFDYDYSRDICY